MRRLRNGMKLTVVAAVAACSAWLVAIKGAAGGEFAYAVIGFAALLAIVFGVAAVDFFFDMFRKEK